MTSTANGPTTAAALSAVITIINAAENLRAKGAAPEGALAIVLREGDGGLPLEIEAMARELWAVAIGSDGSGPGGAAVLARLDRILACAAMLCSFGVEPCEAIGVLRWIDAPTGLERVARDAWAVAVGSGAVVRVPWTIDSGPGAATVADALSRILVLADALRSIGVEPCNVIHVLRMVALPPRLATMVYATWAIAAGFDDDGSDDEVTGQWMAPDDVTGDDERTGLWRTPQPATARADGDEVIDASPPSADLPEPDAPRQRATR
jgi:hypothetical protein